MAKRGCPGDPTVVLVLLLGVSCLFTCVAAGGVRHYTNQFAVLVPGGHARAERAATQHGCVVTNTISGLADHYLLECHSIRKRSVEHSHHHELRLGKSDDIHWVEQQYIRKRTRRSGFFSSLFGNLFNEEETSTSPKASDVVTRSTTGSPYYTWKTTGHIPPGSGWRPWGVTSVYRHTSPRPTSPSPKLVLDGTTPEDLAWSDPLFHKQWYLLGGASGDQGMNVTAAWRDGFTGRGVVVSILDDGIQTNHPDLAANYDGRASLDINSNDDDPTPRDDGRGTNRHGTRNAGVVAAQAGNEYCGVGVAPNASIGGIRMLDGDVTDFVEARSLSYNSDHIDIYSVSWGPDDDGRTLEGPGSLASRAFVKGILEGRGGKGSIFVWASGNGGIAGDNCNCDGYTNNIFTLSVSSATYSGRQPFYLEQCASTLATTYSSGGAGEPAVTTCDLDIHLRSERLCTSHHTGTSASAAMAAGICALALEANPELSWRDMQYIVMMTSRYEPLADEPGWTTNAMGRKVSHKFGYGLMNAGAMVELAKRWTTVPHQLVCITPPDTETRTIPAESGASVNASMLATACRDTTQGVYHLEHVQCRVTLNYPRRGNLRLLLTSPAGTQSVLLSQRRKDGGREGEITGWPFMSVHFWGENPAGEWTLSVLTGDWEAPEPGQLIQWQLVLYGTSTQPVQLKSVA